MAIVELATADDLSALIRFRVLRPDRYVLCIKEDSSALYFIPIVTSQHIHTFIYKPSPGDDVEELLKMWHGQTIRVKNVELARW